MSEARQARALMTALAKGETIYVNISIFSISDNAVEKVTICSI